MIFRRLYDQGLAQASYLIGCEATGEAVVIDANRDVAQYIAAAAAEKVHIRCVTETHIHADYVSGSRELAKRTGAQLLLSAEGGPDWQYAFATTDGATLLRDGSSFHVGRVRIDVMHTPGHTPEHLAFLVTDEATSGRPVGLASGDFVFVGDVGRPDLLERAAKVANTMRDSAHVLFHSLQRFRALPDHVQLWPGHGAGSACGKALGALPQSTVGYEKLANWAFAISDEDAFVAEVLVGQPEPPTYFAQMKRINRDGPRILDGLPHPTMLDSDTLSARLAAGAIVVDVRSAEAFGAAFGAGTINIPLSASFSTWAGWLLPYGTDVFLIADDAATCDRAARELAMIGLDDVAGWFPASVVADWAAAGTAGSPIPCMSALELAERLADGDLVVVDVRNRSEWDHGHLPGALHIPLGELAGRVGELPADRHIVVQCQGGTRSAIAASLLRRHAISGVINLRGGFSEWTREGLPVSME